MAFFNSFALLFEATKYRNIFSENIVVSISLRIKEWKAGVSFSWDLKVCGMSFSDLLPH